MFFLRLGELRSLLRDFDNKLFVKLCVYDSCGNSFYDLDVDVVNDKCVFLRLIEEEE